MKMNQLKKGQEAVIVGIDSDIEVSQRLLALGLLPDAPVKLVQVAPFGDPITVECLGNQISLRREHAELINVEIK